MVLQGRVSTTVCLVLTIIHLVQGGSQNPFRLDDKIDPSFDPNYFEKFLEPDSEEYRNVSCPKYWHVKEMLQVLEMWDHPGEEHVIITDDGYIFSIFRIISNELKPNTTPVLILPGFLAGPEVFLHRGNEDLPIMLADAGYDVWMGTYRGNYYGRKHVNMTIKDRKFWDFSFHENGYYDVPAMIDHIQRTTGPQRVSVIAHSMGNAALMVMLALRPEYNDKVGLFVGLAPYAVVRSEMGKAIRLAFVEVAKNNDNTKSTDFFQRRKINPFASMCWSLPRFCHFLIEALAGKNMTPTNWSLFPVMMSYFPDGSSNKNLFHLMANRHEKFLQYDYGIKENLVRYKSTTPPLYDLKNVRVPVSLYYGENDSIVSIKGIKSQMKALPNAMVKTTVLKAYVHLSFLNAMNTREMLYNPILDDLKKYETNG